MRYLEINTGPCWSDEPLPWWCRILQKILPAANPDIEKLYFQTHIWWLELDDENKPQREIGFDENKKPIVIGPIGNNFGYLVDCSDDWSDSKEDSEDASELFEKTWDVVYTQFKHLEK